MRGILLFILLFLSAIAGSAQQGPVYGQYFHNPVLYNPAFAGADMYPALILTHQRQLMGIEDAPVASTLVFHTPILENIAVGAKIYTESQGLLNSSAGQIALVYVLPFNEKTNLRFGLAGGVTKNQIDLSSATESQLAYLSDITTSFTQTDISFGVVLNSQNFKVGISFPNMTKRNVVSNQTFSAVEMAPLEHLVLTGTVKLDLAPGRLQLEPVLIYERMSSSQEQRIEGGALLYLKELVWVGSTYQYNYGISGLLGIKIKEYASLGYAYEMTSNITNGFKNASHEVQLKIKLGKVKEFIKQPKTHTPRFQQSDF